jgi:8-amino-7-oxononanoate synthase
MTGNAADVAAFARVTREYDALLYVDDAHGFGVIGERADDELSPYGKRGNGIVRYFDESYDHVIFVSGLSKSYSSLAAFLACPPELKRLLKTAAPPTTRPLRRSPLRPRSRASKSTTAGAAIRADLWKKTIDVLDCLERIAHTPIAPGSRSSVPLARHEDIDALDASYSRTASTRRSPYPLVPRDEVGFRIQLTPPNDHSGRAALDALGVSPSSTCSRCGRR